jgi:hypothetical protein
VDDEGGVDVLVRTLDGEGWLEREEELVELPSAVVMFTSWDVKA